MTQPKLQDVLNDPDFHRLNPVDQKTALGKLFPDYSSLSATDQAHVLSLGTNTSTPQTPPPKINFPLPSPMAMPVPGMPNIEAAPEDPNSPWTVLKQLVKVPLVSSNVTAYKTMGASTEDITGMRGYPEIYHGGQEVLHAKEINPAEPNRPRYEGAARVIGGAMEASKPLIYTGFATHPGPLVISLMTGQAGSYAGQKISAAFGASPEAQELAAQLFGLIGAFAGGGVEGYREFRGRLVDTITKDVMLKYKEAGITPEAAKATAQEAVTRYEETGDAKHLGAENVTEPSTAKVAAIQSQKLVGAAAGTISAPDRKEIPHADQSTPSTVHEQAIDSQPTTKVEAQATTIEPRTTPRSGGVMTQIEDITYKDLRETERAAAPPPSQKAVEGVSSVDLGPAPTSKSSYDTAIREGNEQFGRGNYNIVQSPEGPRAVAKTGLGARAPQADTALALRNADNEYGLARKNLDNAPDDPTQVERLKREVVFRQQVLYDKLDQHIRASTPETAQALQDKFENEAGRGLKAAQGLQDLSIRDIKANELRKTLADPFLPAERRDLINRLTGNTKLNDTVKVLKYVRGEKMQARVELAKKRIRQQILVEEDPKRRADLTALLDKNVLLTLQSVGAPPIRDAQGRLHLAGLLPRITTENLRAIVGKKINTLYGWSTKETRARLGEANAAIRDAPNEDLRTQARANKAAIIEAMRNEYLKGLHDKAVAHARVNYDLLQRVRRARGQVGELPIDQAMREFPTFGEKMSAKVDIEIADAMKRFTTEGNLDRLALPEAQGKEIIPDHPSESSTVEPPLPETLTEAEARAKEFNENLISKRLPSSEQTVLDTIQKLRGSKNFLEQQQLAVELEKAIHERDMIGTLVARATKNPLKKHGLTAAEQKVARTAATQKVLDILNPPKGLGPRGAFKGPDKPGEAGVFSLRRIQKPVASKPLAEIQDIREAASKLRQPTFMERLSVVPDKTSQDFYDQFVNLPGSDSLAAKLAHPELGGAVQRVEHTLGHKLTTEENPYREASLAAGGGGGQVQAAQIRYSAILHEAKKAGLEKNLKAVLDAKGYDRAIRNIESKKAAAEAEYRQAKTARDQIANDVKGGRRTPKSAERGMNKLRNQMTAAHADFKEFTKKLGSRTVVPKNLDRPKIAAELTRIEQDLGLDDWQKINTLTRRVWDLNKEAWDAAHVEGIISDTVYKQGIALGKEYIPLHRIQDIVNLSERRFGGTSLQLRQQNILKALRGSSLPNIDPIEDSFRQHAETMREINRNSATRVFVEFAHSDPTGLGAMIRKVPTGYKPVAGEGVIGYYVDGEPISYKVPDYIADTLNNASPVDVGVLDKALGKFKGVFQTGTTLANLAFSVPNAIRDVQDMLILSKGGTINPASMPKLFGQWFASLAQAVVESPEYLEMLKSRAAFSTLQKVIAPEDFLDFHHKPLRPLNWDQNRSVRGNVWNLITAPIRTIEDFNNAVEEATKLTTFKRMRQAGSSPAEAAFETRRMGGSPDFARRGTKTASVNLLFMFFNANVQGIGRTLKWAVKNPVRLTGLLASYSLMQMVLHQHNAQYTDENGQPYWDQVSNTDKQNYFVILHGGTYNTSSGGVQPEVWKIPKGHVARVFFNPAQDALEPLFYSKSTEGAQSALNLLSNILPGNYNLKSGEIVKDLVRGTLSSLNPLPREGGEQAMNYDAYSGIPIVARRLQGLSPKYQITPTTSKTAAEIGNVIGVAPVRVEHAVRGFTGGLGEQILNISDTIQGQRKGGGLPLEGDEAIAKAPIIGPIARRFVGSALDQREKDLEEKFYNMADIVRRKKADFDMLKQAGPTRKEEFRQYRDENLPYIKASRIVVAVQNRLSALRTQQQRVSLSPKLSVEEKRARISRLYNARIVLLQRMNDRVLPTLPK